MKTFVLWLIKVFHLDIPKETTKFVTKEVKIPVLEGDSEISGNLKVEGDLLVTGKLTVSGGATCMNYNKNK